MSKITVILLGGFFLFTSISAQNLTTDLESEMSDSTSTETASLNLSSSTLIWTAASMNETAVRNVTSADTLISSSSSSSSLPPPPPSSSFSSSTPSTAMIPLKHTTSSHAQEKTGTAKTTAEGTITPHPAWRTKERVPATTQISNSAKVGWIWEPVIWSWSLGLQMVSVSLGLVGNFLVMLVLFQRRNTGSSADAFIGNLAAADFLTSLFLIPLPRATQVPSTILGMVYCKIIFTSVLVWLCIFTSTLTLMAISVERFLAISYPIHFHRLKKRKHINICIILLWVASVIANLFIPLTIHVNDESNECKVEFMTFASQITVGVVTLLICYVIPTVTMLVTNMISARTLQRQSQRFPNTLNAEGQSTASMKLLAAKKRVLQMLLLVIIIFNICWGPNSVAYFLYNMRVLDSSYLYGPIDRILVLLAFYNSCANPIIYTLRYPLFRKALRKLFTCSKIGNHALFEFHISAGTTNLNSREKTESV